MKNSFLKHCWISNFLARSKIKISLFDVVSCVDIETIQINKITTFKVQEEFESTCKNIVKKL